MSRDNGNLRRAAHNPSDDRPGPDSRSDSNGTAQAPIQTYLHCYPW